MSLHLPDLRYECVHCGYSCQTLDVEVSSTEYQALRVLDPDSVSHRSDRFWLRKEEHGCHFLLDCEQGRCGLHRAHGMAAKPRPCQEFPFRALETPGGVFVGASFACTAIAQRAGPQVTEETLYGATMTLPETPLAAGLDFDWQHYLRWEGQVGDLMRQGGQAGLWSAALQISVEVLGGQPRQPTQGLEAELKSVFRGLLALAEGPMEAPDLMAFLQAHAEDGTYSSRILEAPVNVAEILARWEEPWSLWPEAVPFFEHLLFRKYLLEGPDVHSRICSLPIMAQILEFLVLARNPQGGGIDDLRWAMRILEARLTFHARGLEGYLGKCGQAFLGGLH